MILGQFTFIAALVIFASSAYATGETAPSFTLDGQLFADAAATTGLADTGVFDIRILDPSLTCVLYQETQTFDTRATAGLFLASVGSALGAPKRGSLDVNNGMGLVYSNVNATGIPGRTSGGGACTYVPQAGDVRFVRTTVRTDADGQTRTLNPDLKLESAPTAVASERSENLQGLTPNNFLRLATSGNPNLTQGNLETVFASYATLQSLLAGTSPQYLQTTGGGLATLPQPASPPGAGGAAANEGRLWYDLATHAIRYSDGTAYRTLIDAADLGTAAQQVVQLGAAAQTLLGAGSPSAPTYAFGASPGTGVYSPGANQLAFAVNGTTGLYVAANGNVGVGTSAPINTFSVNGASRFDGNIYGSSFVYGNLGFIGSPVTGSEAVSGNLTIDSTTHPTKGIVAIAPTGGNVGVGTSTPISKLHVVDGNLSLTGTSGSSIHLGPGYNNGAWGVRLTAVDNGSTGHDLRVQTRMTGSGMFNDAFAVTSAGRVGIGTSTPSVPLEVKGAVIANSLSAPMDLTLTSNQNYPVYVEGGYGGIVLGGYGENVDVGSKYNMFQTTSPPLRVWGKNLTTTNTTNVDVYNDTNGLFTVAPSSPGDVTGMLVKTNLYATGKVGVGTSAPTTALQVNGTVTANAFSVNGTPVGTSTSSYWNQSGGDLSYTLGKVGIGTSAPQALEHVYFTSSGGVDPFTIRSDVGHVIGVDQYGGFRANTLLMAYDYNVGTYAFSNFGALYITSGVNGTTAANISLMPSGTGNVGVGLTSPTTKLQVAGVISPSADNTYALGSASLRFTSVFATSGVVSTSDERTKRDVRDSELGLAFVRKLRPVSFAWREGEDQDRHFGLIAQEAEGAIRSEGAAAAGLVTYDAATDRYGMRYSELIAPLIKAVQELYGAWTGTRDEVALLRERVARAEAEVARSREDLAQTNRRLDQLMRRLDRR